MFLQAVNKNHRCAGTVWLQFAVQILTGL